MHSKTKHWREGTLQSFPTLRSGTIQSVILAVHVLRPRLYTVERAGACADRNVFLRNTAPCLGLKHDYATNFKANSFLTFHWLTGTRAKIFEYQYRLSPLSLHSRHCVLQTSFSVLLRQNIHTSHNKSQQKPSAERMESGFTTSIRKDCDGINIRRKVLYL
uniref:Uncharacterized protein n=1 Tax=Timema tahoe TaxID=61484 RepID=A0A7R9IJK5_9NEOP|nr:unnamed protein product [Timema tahoe]